MTRAKTFGKKLMRDSKPAKILAWTLAVVGLSLCALPLYADLFTRELVDPEPSQLENNETESLESEYAIGVSYSETFTMMYVSPWVPVGGAFMTLFGGFLIGRLRAYSVAAATSDKRNAEQVGDAKCD